MSHRQTAILAALFIASVCYPAAAQIAGDGDGTMLFHGHYCGPGNDGLDKAPIDGLDAACRHHDLCYGREVVTTCGCNAALAREASAVATSPRTEPDVAILAGMVANGALALPCHP